MYVAAMETLRKRGRQDETQCCEFQPAPQMLMSFFCKFFFESHLNDQTQGSGAGFFYF